jgi:hypothetical protein
MVEVTYFVALPFVAADDGIEADEPTECFNPTAVVMSAETRAQSERLPDQSAFLRPRWSRHWKE